MENSHLLILTGPESSGKSTLATQLSDYFQTPLVPEISREYLARKAAKAPSFSYQQEDLLEIAQQQFAQESVLLDFQVEKLICDTDLLVLIIWSEVKYGTCDPWIIKTFEQSIASNNLRHYLLCDWNIPWQADPLRENPLDREALYEKYLNKLKEYDLNFTLVSGDQNQRFQQVLNQFT